MADIKVMLWFDTEDYITEEADDALLCLMEMLDKRGVKGIFKIVGEKARVLEARGRTDILQKLKQHEIGFHTNTHSLHPTVSEYTEKYGFKIGADEFMRREGPGLEDLNRISGSKSKCYGQAGYSWAPQAFPVLKKWGIPVNLDVHDQITLNKKPFWYCGVLHLTDMAGIMRMDLIENGLDEGIQRFDQVYDKLSENGIGLVSIYYHPCEFSCTAFWDAVNYNYGHNTPRVDWKSAPLRTRREMEHYVEMLGQFIDYTMSKPNVEYITSEQVIALELSECEILDAGEVKHLAKETSDELTYRVYNDQALSAADIHSLFSQFLLGQELKPELIYGPENEVKSEPAGKVKLSDMKKALSEDYPKVQGFKQLPDYFWVGEYRINPLDLTCTMAKAIAKDLRDDDHIEIISGVLKAKQHAKDTELWGPKWSPFPKDLRVPNIIRMSQMQTWTLKPALF